MKKYIILTSEGNTEPPNSDYECNNHQVICWTTGKDVEEAKANFVNNPDNKSLIEDCGFDPDNWFLQQMAASFNINPFSS